VLNDIPAPSANDTKLRISGLSGKKKLKAKSNVARAKKEPVFDIS
jgi:hypothetical protein